jgi:hypothetical protein
VIIDIKVIRMSDFPERYKKLGFTGYNQPKKSNKPGKKEMVVAKEGDVVKLIHYGDSSMGHNYSEEARKNFKARHGKNIAKGKLSPAWWSNERLWKEGGSSKQPPKSQKLKFGK